jgi:hypothetical protein
MQALVLGHCVVVARSGTGDEFDFVTHGGLLRRLNALTVGSEVSNNLLDTVLVNDSEALVRDAQAYETLLGFKPKTDCGRFPVTWHTLDMGKSLIFLKVAHE